MKRLKGPELKLSELKVPDFLKDLYWDLRDRHLVPLVALAVVAIVAVPILLGGGSKQEPDAGVAAPGLASGSSASERAQLTVVQAEPGLREPSKRLAGRPSKDPFHQHYTGPVFNHGGGAPEEASTTVTSEASTTGSSGGPSEASAPSPSPKSPVEPAPAESSPGGSGGEGSSNAGSGSGGGSPGQITLYTFAIDVSVARSEATASDAKKMGEPKTMHEVLPTTALPSQKTPVVTYLGVDPKNGKKALLLVSPEVESVFGDAKCLSGTTSCQLLELEPGLPEVFVYGPDRARYKINVRKIEPVQSGKVAAP
jgi:hypothetical protein